MHIKAKFKNATEDLGILSTLTAAILAVLLVGGVVAGAVSLVWLLWIFVFTNVWPDGPVMVVNPPFLVFLAAWLLVGIVKNKLFKIRKDKEA